MKDTEKPDNGFEEKNKINGGTLYLVATPIGNLSDISQRALKVLEKVDFIAAEDTRNSGKMLMLLGIEKKPMVSYFEHNKREKGEYIAEKLKEGQSCALITDAGTPGISDPGADIVALCVEKGICVTSVPGCCAGINALILSGLSTDSFVFEGFLPTKKSERAEKLEKLSLEERTLIIYEAPHRLTKTLEEFTGVFGSERRIALCREMTKLNEEIMRTSIKDAAKYYSDNNPRGEYVLVIEGAKKEKTSETTPDEIINAVKALVEGGMVKGDAIKKVAAKIGAPKSVVYDIVAKNKDI